MIVARRLCLLGPAAWLAGRAMAAAERAQTVAVLYPEIGEPYRTVFSKILSGIEERLQQRMTAIAVGAEADAQPLAEQLSKRAFGVVIALGRNGLRVANLVDRSIEVVSGCIVSPGEGESRSATLMSLAPDPSLLMARLRQLQPAVRRVTVVYSARNSGWLIKFARDAARQQQLELRALEADDLKAALKAYQDFFAGPIGRADALWLPQDSATVDEATVLPLVLKEAWERHVVLFSSNVAHVRRGALFSLYPNNVELGRSLGASALGYLGIGAAPPRGVLPLREVLAALNTRTADHLGLELSARQQQGFELLFPER